MKGADLIEILMKEFDCPNKNQLATKLGTSPAKIQYWESTKPTATIVRNIFRLVQKTGPKADLIKMLMKEFACSNKNQLAAQLGTSPAKIQYWETNEPTATIVRNIVRLVRNTAIRNAIDPVMEFHKLKHDHGHKDDTLRKKIDNKEICERLNSAKGIYSFYDSNGRVIYIGKTEKNSLMIEMSQAYGLIRPNYRRKLLGNSGKLKSHKLKIEDTADFVSAYEVDENAIANIEALLIRMIPNDVVNSNTENFRLV